MPPSSCHALKRFSKTRFAETRFPLQQGGVGCPFAPLNLTCPPTLIMSTSTASRLAFALLAGASASAQTSPPPTAPSDQAVVMDPFDVTSVQSDRYQASNTISGTAMNTLLKDVPMSINVITAEFGVVGLVGLGLGVADTALDDGLVDGVRFGGLFGREPYPDEDTFDGAEESHGGRCD